MKLKALFVAALLLAPVTFTFHAPLAFAQTATTGETTPPVIASSPEAVTAAKEDTHAWIEWGNFVSYAAGVVASVLIPILLGIATWAARKLPGLAGMVARRYIASNGEQLIQNLTDYALNAVQGAAKDKKLDVNLGSTVIATAVERVVNLQNADAALKALVDKLGGPKGIAEKVFRTLDLDETASKGNVLDAGLAKATRYPLNKG